MRRVRQFRRFRGIRRKRGNQGTWFPINGVIWNAEGDSYYDASVSDTSVAVSPSKALGPTNFVTPVTADYSFNKGQAGGFAIEQQPSLRDYVEGNDYILKRLVGEVNFFVEADSGSETPWSSANYWKYIQIVAAFFVARTNDTDQTLPDLTTDEFDPLGGTNIQNPWIWRRSWILANPNNLQTTVSGQIVDETSSNRSYASINGTHFDTKSRRRIRREERLWFTYSAIGWDGVRDEVNGQSSQPYVNLNLDVRLFGKMVKGKNSSAF